MGTGIINVDFRNLGQREEFLQHYGGENNIKEKLPYFHLLYTQTKDAHLNEEDLDYQTLDQYEANPGGFVDSVSVKLSYLKGKLRINAITSLVEKSQFIDQHLVIKSTDGEVLGKFSKSEGNISWHNTVLDVSLDYKKNPKVMVEYTVVWLDSIMKVQKSVEELDLAAIVDSLTTQITLINPVSKQTPARDIVYVAYGRNASKEIMDYTYPGNKNNVPNLVLDFGAKITFNNTAKKFRNINPQTFLLKLDSKNGVALYNNTNFMDKFAASDGGFTFSLDSDWQNKVPTKTWPIKNIVDIYFEVEYITTTGETGTIIIDSEAEESGAYICKAPKLSLIWGCLEGSTPVLIADGSTKKICDLQLGDKVISIQPYGVAEVCNIWRGIDETLLHIETVSGDSVRCTIGHPILTKDGYKKACDLNAADLVMNQAGEYESLKFIYPLTMGAYEVYNLDLKLVCGDGEYGCSMVCGGIVTGDNHIQNTAVAGLMEDMHNLHKNECGVKNSIFNNRE